METTKHSVTTTNSNSSTAPLKSESIEKGTLDSFIKLERELNCGQSGQRISLIPSLLDFLILSIPDEIECERWDFSDSEKFKAGGFAHNVKLTDITTTQHASSPKKGSSASILVPNPVKLQRKSSSNALDQKASNQTGGGISSAFSWIFPDDSNQMRRLNSSPSMDKSNSLISARALSSSRPSTPNGNLQASSDALIQEVDLVKFISDFKQFNEERDGQTFLHHLPMGSVFNTLNVGRLFYLLFSDGISYYEPWLRLVFNKVIPTCHKLNQDFKRQIEFAIGLSSGEVLVLSFPSLNIKRFNKENCWGLSQVSQLEWLDTNRVIVSFDCGTVLILNIRLNTTLSAITKLSYSQGLISMNFSFENTSCWWGMIQFGCRMSIPDIKISFQENRIAFACKDGRLRVFLYPDFRLLACFKSYYGGFTSLSWSFDGKYLIAGSEDDLVSIFDMESLKLIVRCQGHKAWISSLTFIPFRSQINLKSSLVSIKKSTRTTADEQISSDQSPASPLGVSQEYRFISVGQDGLLLYWQFKPKSFAKSQSVANSDSTPEMIDLSKLVLKEMKRSNEGLSGSFQWEVVNSQSLGKSQVPFISPRSGMRLSDEPLTNVRIILNESRMNPASLVLVTCKGRLLFYNVTL